MGSLPVKKIRVSGQKASCGATEHQPIPESRHRPAVSGGAYLGSLSAACTALHSIAAHFSIQDQTSPDAHGISRKLAVAAALKVGLAFLSALFLASGRLPIYLLCPSQASCLPSNLFLCLSPHQTSPQHQLPSKLTCNLHLPPWHIPPSESGRPQSAHTCLFLPYLFLGSALAAKLQSYPTCELLEFPASAATPDPSAQTLEAAITKTSAPQSRWQHQQSKLFQRERPSILQSFF